MLIESTWVPIVTRRVAGGIKLKLIQLSGHTLNHCFFVWPFLLSATDKNASLRLQRLLPWGRAKPAEVSSDAWNYATLGCLRPIIRAPVTDFSDRISSSIRQATGRTAGSHTQAHGMPFPVTNGRPGVEAQVRALIFASSARSTIRRTSSGHRSSRYCMGDTLTTYRWLRRITRERLKSWGWPNPCCLTRAA